MSKMSCILFRCAAMAGFALSAIGSTTAQDYPNKPIRILIPFPPGGGNDALIRVIAPKLSEALGELLVIDNRAGAGGNIAAETTAKSAPDGYTLLMGFSPILTINKSLYANLGFDPLGDFAPITQLATAQYMLVIHPSVQANTVTELVNLAKAKPGSLNYASSGIGTPLHLAAELFKRRAGIDIVHISYKGGGPAATAMLAGEAQIMFSSMASAMPQVRANRLRALAVTGLKRSTLAPEVPTLNESGYPGFNVTAWGSLVAAARTPRAIIDKLSDRTVKVLRMPGMREVINNVGYEPTGTTPEQLGEIIRQESALWAKVIKDANIRAE
jgi:tripartite-type tricarboxylate transporter receptor subunit TctC